MLVYTNSILIRNVVLLNMTISNCSFFSESAVGMHKSSELVSVSL
jgi:hypothetical protein